MCPFCGSPEARSDLFSGTVAGGKVVVGALHGRVAPDGIYTPD